MASTPFPSSSSPSPSSTLSHPPPSSPSHTHSCSPAPCQSPSTHSPPERDPSLLDNHLFNAMRNLQPSFSDPDQPLSALMDDTNADHPTEASLCQPYTTSNPSSSDSRSVPTPDTRDSTPSPNLPRLIVVSNRLPVTLSKTDSGDWNFRGSSGGLVSALAGVKNEIPFVWVGWTGVEVASSDQDLLKTRFLDEMNCFPVFLSEHDSNLYYNGFCNDVLWPLFHYVPLPIVSTDGERKFDAKYWQAYSKANHRFAEAVMQVYQPGDLIWVQDYHLMLLPSLLRKRLPNVTIGFFLHTPFPSSEVYRILPVRDKVLEGVLAADLIGFHAYDYASHFLSVCTRILGLEASPKGVRFKEHFAYVGIFPIGIDPSAWLNALQTPSVKERIIELEDKFRGKKVVLGVDRLDYIKGVPHKLMAFEILLASQAQWKHKVVLVQIGVPSRTEVDEYKKLISQTNELVGRINAQYGSVEQAPIIFINQSVSFDDLCALYAVADVALVTSIRDGMNLVSYEYVVCQQDRHGVLVLSEFAGSAHSLSSALRINPWNIEEMAEALHKALTLPEKERKVKHQRLFQYVRKHTATFWAQSFVKELQRMEMTIKTQDIYKPLQSLLRVQSDVLPEMRTRQRRLFLMEYEGTLAEPVALPDMAVPSESLLCFLSRLASHPENYVYIMSGRSKQTLESWFGTANVGLISEHGCDYVHPNGEEWQTVVELNTDSWKDSVLPILQYFQARTPGAHLETKEKTITWHFCHADPLFGSWQAKELQLLLAESCVSLPVEVVSGPRYLELRPENVSRVAAVEHIIGDRPDGIDFVFAIGSDKLDEKVFSYLNNYVQTADGRVYTVTCRVGGKSDTSSADQYVPDSSDFVIRVLKELAPSHKHEGENTIKPRRGSGVSSHGDFRRRRHGGSLANDRDFLVGSVPRSTSYDGGMTGMRQSRQTTERSNTRVSERKMLQAHAAANLVHEQEGSLSHLDADDMYVSASARSAPPPPPPPSIPKRLGVARQISSQHE